MTGASPMHIVRLLVLIAATVLLAPRVLAGAPAPHDAALREGYALLAEERHEEAAAALASIPSEGYDLGDYGLFFRGAAFARQGKEEEAAALLESLNASWPDSPLRPVLSHELAYAAARRNDLETARRRFAASRGKVSGNGRKAEEGYVAARLLEVAAAVPSGGSDPPPTEGGSDPPPPDPFLPSAEAARAHLENFALYTAQEGAALSMERLWKWRADGKLAGLGLDAAFSGRFANALFRAGEAGRAGAVYEEALETHPRSDDYYAVLLGYAEFLRKQGSTSRARALLADALDGAPEPFRLEVEFLSARVDWRAGRQAEARRKFLEIAENGAHPAFAERARYQAAWIAEEELDIPAATREFGKLSVAADEPVRQESIFRHAFGLYRQGRYAEALQAFEAGEKTGFSSVERARHSYWKARTLGKMGERESQADLFRALSADPGGGPFALFSARHLGRNPFEMLTAPSSGETRFCDRETERLWERVRTAGWSAADAEMVRRAERLTLLGLVEYAVIEAERVDRAAVRKALGLVDGGTPALFRYLAGDLRGAIRDTSGLPPGTGPDALIDRIRFPMAPQYLGDCDEKRSGIDPLVLHSIIRQESLFQHNALSPAGAVGLMQLMPGTARETARRERIPKQVRRQDLLKPELNVRLGAAYLARLLRSYGGDYFRAVAAYNAGETAVGRWWEGADGDPAMFLENVSYRETRMYLRRVFFNLLQYYRIYRPEMFARYFPTAPAEGQPVPGASGSPRGAGTAAPAADPAPPPPPGRASPAAEERGG
jgi:soluble lytic murein transglycosylase